jgi:hypothetical protein
MVLILMLSKGGYYEKVCCFSEIKQVLFSYYYNIRCGGGINNTTEQKGGQ